VTRISGQTFANQVAADRNVRAPLAMTDRLPVNAKLDLRGGKNVRHYCRAGMQQRNRKNGAHWPQAVNSCMGTN